MVKHIILWTLKETDADKKLNTDFMKNHHFFNLYINCAGLFLSFFIELNNFYLSHRLIYLGQI